MKKIFLILSLIGCNYLLFADPINMPGDGGGSVTEIKKLRSDLAQNIESQKDTLIKDFEEARQLAAKSKNKDLEKILIAIGEEVNSIKILINLTKSKDFVKATKLRSQIQLKNLSIRQEIADFKFDRKNKNLQEKLQGLVGYPPREEKKLFGSTAEIAGNTGSIYDLLKIIGDYIKELQYK